MVTSTVWVALSLNQSKLKLKFMIPGPGMDPHVFSFLKAGPRYPQGLRSAGKNGVITGSIAIGQIQAYVQMIASGECRHIDVYREAG